MSSSAASPEETRRRQFFGRRRGPGLGPRQQALLEQELPRFEIALPPDGAMIDLEASFGRPPEWLGLEIGFGKGEHLAALAKEMPARDFVGAEPFANGLAALTGSLVRLGLGNVRLFGDDARLLIDRLPASSVDIVWLLHPDPWPKRRHRKRRFVNNGNLDALARILKPGGELQIATDSAIYKRWTALAMSGRPDFLWMARSAADWRTPPPDWLETRYARKAGREGRSDVWFRYRRIDAASSLGGEADGSTSGDRAEYG